MRTLTYAAFACACVLAAQGCVLLAGKADYADYRAIRLADDEQTRAIAMHEYIDKHPDGHWRDEVGSTRKAHEIEVFESGKDSRAGLEHYLRAYPDGTFVIQARSRLQAVELIAQQQKQARAQAVQVAEARRVRADELRRTWLGRFLSYWVKTLVELHGWGEPIPEVARQNAQFSRAFAALPRPRCTQDECVKYYTSEYAMPVPGGNRIERKLSLLLRLRMKGNKLERAELLLPEHGFSRWYELESRKPVASGDRAGRERAMEWALERAATSIQGVNDGIAATAGTAVPVIDAPSIGPTGELVDTSIEAPTDPQRRVQPEDNAGIGVQVVKPQDDSATELVKPHQPSAAPDMTFDAIGVGKQGQRVTATPTAPALNATQSGATPEMTFAAPIEVPKEKGAAGVAAAPAAQEPVPPAAAADEKPIAAVAREFQGLGLHITLWAAGSDGSAYDGIVIERTAAAKTKGAAVKPAAKPAAAVGAPAANAAPKPAGGAAAAPAAPAPPAPAPKPAAPAPPN
jgi:hypothetical protein